MDADAAMTGPASNHPQPWSNRRWWAWVIFPLLVIVLAMAVQMQPGVSALAVSHRTLFFAINQVATYWPAAAWSILTTLGDASVLFALLSPLLLMRPQALVAVLAAVPVGGLSSVLLKRVFDAPRPAAVLDAAQFHLIGPVLSNHSFPSGHTLSAFAAAVAVLAVLQPARQAARPATMIFAITFITGIGVAAMVGISRVAVGAHWPVDLLAGAACGWLAGLSGAAASRRWPVLWQAARSRVWMMAALLGAAAWLLWRPVDYPLGAPAIWLAVAMVALALITSLWRAK